jgi:rsbT co-antagonist protein RsbR
MDGAALLLHERSELLLSAVLVNVPVVLWEIDAQGTFHFHDGSALDAMGLQSHELVGKNVFEIYPDDVVRDLRQAMLTGEKMHGFTEADGRSWESWLLPTTEDGALRSVIGLSLDVTERKRAEAELHAKLEVIERQRLVIRELSVPIIQVWDSVLALPLTGVFDSGRAAEVMDELLGRVCATQARFVILDLTGVDVLDTATANRLISIVRALGLLGCTGIVTGIRPGVAQTIVELGVELAQIRTYATLRDGLRFCMRHLDPAQQRRKNDR